MTRMSPSAVLFFITRFLRSLPDKSWCATLKKRRKTFCTVLAMRHVQHRSLLEGETAAQAAVKSAQNALFSGHSGQRRTGRYLPCNFHGARQPASGLHTFRNQSAVQSCAGVNRLPRQNHLHCDALADSADKALRTAIPRHAANANLGLAETRVGPGHYDVRQHREFVAATECSPLHGGNERLRELLNHGPLALTFALAHRVGPSVAHFGDIRTGAKGRASGGNTHAANRCVDRRCTTSRRHSSQQGGAQCVALVGSVEGQNPDARRSLIDEQEVIHAHDTSCASWRAMMMRWIWLVPSQI